MATFLLRVGLPDRPGALGAVASRIGAVRADVVALDIVGTANGRAVDEFVVELADESHVSLLLSEVAEVDGVEVEEVRIVPADVANRRLDAYDTALALLEERSAQGVLEVIAARTRHDLGATWSAVVDTQERMLLSTAGEPPAAPWLLAYVDGTRWRTGPTRTQVHGPAADVAWVELVAWDLVLAAGRPGWHIGEQERSRLAAIARLADIRWLDLSERGARLSHPSRVS
jgi:hypothetical protein